MLMDRALPDCLCLVAPNITIKGITPPFHDSQNGSEGKIKLETSKITLFGLLNTTSWFDQRICA